MHQRRVLEEAAPARTDLMPHTLCALCSSPCMLVCWPHPAKHTGNCKAVCCCGGDGRLAAVRECRSRCQLLLVACWMRADIPGGAVIRRV